MNEVKITIAKWKFSSFFNGMKWNGKYEFLFFDSYDMCNVMIIIIITKSVFTQKKNIVVVNFIFISKLNWIFFFLICVEKKAVKKNSLKLFLI